MKHLYIIKGICAALLLAGATSCNDWLDVQPASQVEDTELFNSESGFKEALSGVYSSMVSDNTYTKELLFGMVGILGQEWDNYPSTYQDIVDYNYSTTTPTAMIAAIWSTSYNGIANVNNILQHIDDKRNLFSYDNYQIIKGEALALRAFLHFDLLRCFGVSYAQNPQMPSIPYCTELTYRVSPQLTVSEVAEHIEDDLLEAEELLKADPIYTGETITELIDNGYLMNRQVHLNYYAVKGLQARLYMWMQRYGDARRCAQEVIDSDIFPWTNAQSMQNGEDYTCASEHLFGLNNVNLSTLADNYFNEEYNSASFSLVLSSLLSSYDNDTDDYRYLSWFQAGTGELVDNRYLTKYYESSSTDSYYQNKMPLIKISEMYLIVSECDYRETGNGLDALNELRLARNANTYETQPTDYYAELIREYRREFIGEGQLFFLYKRLNRPSIIGSDADAIGEKVYTFPLPLSETEASQRENNR